ncbi:WD40/YVTN/BNR-like repeat-containing protein [Arenimonas sp.]|uniref:WD40/YVTN/BNR-like repeat-containing protein n=1 Tax=Arenimonas sp. TaxID=1872635 RepID=UPI0039E2D67D
MSMRRSLVAAISCLLLSFAAAGQDVSHAPEDQAPEIEVLVSPVTVRLRGLSAVDENTAWASGREGTVLRTIDAGKTWSVFKVPGAEKLDFRDVEGFSAKEAVVLSIGPGEDSRVYRTSDAGKTWILALQNRDPRAFFDCFDFEGNEGRLLGDPIDGRFQLLATKDRGRSWAAVQGPEAVQGEAAFAASGTCVLLESQRLLSDSIEHEVLMTVVASGGDAARLHWHRQMPGSKSNWLASEIDESPKAASAGFFSIASGKLGRLVVGGDFQREAEPGRAIVLGVGAMHYGVDTNRTTPAHYRRSENEEELVPERRIQDVKVATFPSVREAISPPGYRSSVACSADRPLCVATGPSGSDSWDGKQWSSLAGAGYDSVDVASSVFWFSGDNGRLGRLVLPEVTKP